MTMYEFKYDFKYHSTKSTKEYKIYKIIDNKTTVYYFYLTTEFTQDAEDRKKCRFTDAYIIEWSSTELNAQHIPISDVEYKAYVSFSEFELIQLYLNSENYDKVFEELNKLKSVRQIWC